MPDVINTVETNGASIFHLSGQPHQAAVSLAPKNFVPYDFSVFTRLANPRNNRVTIETHANGARLAILDFFVPGLQNYQPDGAKPKDEVKEKEKEKDEKEATTPSAPVTTAGAEPAKEDIAASPAVPKAAPAAAAAPAKHTKKRFSASDLSIESSDKV